MIFFSSMGNLYIVVGDLLARGNRLFGIDYNLLVTLDGDDPSVAVGLHENKNLISKFLIVFYANKETMIREYS